MNFFKLLHFCRIFHKGYMTIHRGGEGEGGTDGS